MRNGTQMLGGTMARTAARTARSRRKGGAILWVLVGIGLLVAALIIWAFSLKSGPPPVTTAAYQGSMTVPAPFPSLVDKNVSVQYAVQTRNETRPSGAGPAFPPSLATPWVAAGGVTVTFTLSTGDAKFSNGSTQMTATSGSNGVATVTLGPAADGVDTLRFAITVGKSSAPDAVVVPFEVHKP